MQGPAKLKCIYSLDPASQCGDDGAMDDQRCCGLQASVSENVRQALHKQKAARQAAAQVSAAERGQQQQQQQEPSATEPCSFSHGSPIAQPHVPARTAALVDAAEPPLDSASDVRHAGLAANMPLPSCPLHGLETEEAASKLSQAADGQKGLVEANTQRPAVSLPVESVGSQAVSSMSLQQSGEKKSRAKAPSDGRPQLWQVRLHPLCLSLLPSQHDVVCLTMPKHVALKRDDLCSLTVCHTSASPPAFRTI